MLDELFEMMSAGSMESRFLMLITLLDKAETIANSSEEVMSPQLALMIGEAKQKAIEEFGPMNELHTLAKMRERAAAAEEDIVLVPDKEAGS